jgi:hypothetical protein
MGRAATPTVLKLIQGDKHSERFKDDRPKIDGLPVIPPGVKLSVDEQAFYDYLLVNVAVKGVHGAGDGAAFVKLAKLWARVCVADRKCDEQGLVMRNPQTGKPELNPNARLSRDLWQQIGIALKEIGATPSGRVPLAGAHGGAALGEPTSWDEID